MDITVQEVKQRLDAGEHLHLIDVRNPDEHEFENIGGQLVPLGDLADELDSLENLKNEEVIVYCRSGNRSGRAKQMLEQADFTNVRNMLGGMLAYNEAHG
jgi:rhodanese-related sulfurtransferase